RDLALLNQIGVYGFGFVYRRRPGQPLTAPFPAYADFVMSRLPSPWPGQLPGLFTSEELEMLETIVESERLRPVDGAHLAHGDFDVTAIFHLDGLYSGLIDFGEIRGTEPLFDLGHFLLHDGESFRAPLFDHLVAGYQEVQPIPNNLRPGIRTSGILLGLRQLCLWIDRGDFVGSYRVRYRVGRLKE